MRKDKELESLFRKVRNLLGAPVVDVELTDEQLCTFLEICVEDYSSLVHQWTIENQWSTLYGKNLNNTDLAFALSTRTFDYDRDFSFYFSKDAGLQQRGPWELKKDFIEIERGKQNYEIPAGREVNKVMWVNPPTSQAALFANYGGLDVGYGGGYAQMGGGAYGPIGGFYTAPAADIAYLATDLQYKNRLIRGDLVYKITGGPNGTKILHLLSTPGSKLSFGYANGGASGGIGLMGCQVWYTYYDTDEDNADQCRLDNPDVILTPDQVPLSTIDYQLLNDATKTLIRQLLVAKAKQTLALIRGKYSGKIQIPDAEAMLDYQMLLTQGREEEEKTKQDIKDRLERMRPVNMLRDNADMVDSSIRIKRGHPNQIMVI